MCGGNGPWLVGLLLTCLCLAAGAYLHFVTHSIFLGLAIYLGSPLIIFGLVYCYYYEFYNEKWPDGFSEAGEETGQNENISIPVYHYTNGIHYHLNSAYSSDGDHPLNSINIENPLYTEQDTRPLQVSIPPEIIVHNTQDIVRDTRNAESNDNPPRYEELFP